MPVYKKLGLKKKYYSPISSKDFNAIAAPPVQEHPHSVTLPAQTALYKNALPPTKESIAQFNNNGYCILKNFFSPGDAEKINDEIKRLMSNGMVKLNSSNKIMFAINKSQQLSAIANDAILLELLSALLGGEAVLFQSINFLQGSEQETHSDSIHMTTHPPGGLLGVWIALEDITDENGPLHYYPGSHALPYYLNSDYCNEGNRWLLGPYDYTEYEKMIRNKLHQHKLQKRTFTAAKGDVLIWHANLLHGGEPHMDTSRTRKSMVLHYFKKGSVCYHEITQRPALFAKSSHS